MHKYRLLYGDKSVIAIMTRPFSTKTDQGFTLLELVIVMGIMGLLSTAAFSLSTQFSQNQAFTNSYQDLRAQLYDARSQAQSVVSQKCSGQPFNGVAVIFCKSHDKLNRSCAPQCVSNPQPDYEMDLFCNNQTTQIPLQTKNLSNSKITITPDFCSVQFQPFGGQVTGFGNISISGFGNSRIIQVATNGVIQ